MFRRGFGLWIFALLLAAQHFFAAEGRSDETVWSALKSGHYVVLIRHAITDPGVGDPPGFVLGDCSTQRNLSKQGRSDAKRIGEAFRSRGIPISEVLSSRWCRCLDTAKLAFGKAVPMPMLDSMFNESGKPVQEKTRAVLAAAERRPSSGNLVMVTHNQNILEMTGESVSSGEMVIAEIRNGKFRVIGRIDATSG
jgi:broad specificity phosphatase PhoE